ncbi:EGFR adapter protein-like [Culicoides brevitarsis]|uniref:EGFR adapter protein-like n=1 Tax=Culicoides brevitarsis TaxID=469753 RepID=UPI00307B9026
MVYLQKENYFLKIGLDSLISQSKTVKKRVKIDMIMQTDRMRIESKPTTIHHQLSLVPKNNGVDSSTQNHTRAINIFQNSRISHNKSISSDDDLNRIESASSESDENAIELKNTCRRLMEKPPLVKRLTMGLLRAAEDRSPLVHTSSMTTSVPYSQDGYVNEGVICDPERIIATTFGDSCRDTLNQFTTNENEKTKAVTQQYGLNSNNSKQTGEKNELEFKRNFHDIHVHHYPVVPIRNDSLSLFEQNELKGASWFQAGIPREISLEVLSRQPPGAFLVRQSTTKFGCFALSLRVPPPAPKVAHYLILRTIRGYKIKGFTKEFTSLTALITHHSVMPELLPVPLSLPRNYMNVSKQNGDFEYGDIRNVMKKSN